MFTKRLTAKQGRLSRRDGFTTRAIPISLFLALTLAGLIIVEAIREGGFWKPDALVVTVVALILLAVQLAHRDQDRRSSAVVVSLSLLALWWLVRGLTAGEASSFLPLGASILGFAGAFVTIRSLTPSQKEVAGFFVAGLGAMGALVGFAGLIWRWYPMAMPAQRLWRLSTTLTYADAAGVFLAMCLLVALAGGPRRWMARVAVCLCVGGLIATQSRGALLAFACACALVPWRQYVLFLAPLLAGIALGVVAVATSPSTGAVPVLAVALVAALGVSLARVPSMSHLNWRRREVVLVVVVALGALIGTGLLLHAEIALRALAPSDQDRAAEWSAAFHQFVSAPFFGVGPDHLLHFHAVDGTVASFAHNEYLQVAADSGLVGVALLALAVTALFRAVRRVDVLTSCAVGALVCLAVAGVVDFDWHLSFLGLLGGWVAGLAMRPSPDANAI
jgi:O-antigen ligase